MALGGAKQAAGKTVINSYSAVGPAYYTTDLPGRSNNDMTI